MQSRTSNENVSSSYGFIAIPLVALITFVVGYTASRAHLGQAENRNVAPAQNNFVIPHQAEMWSDFGG